MKKLQRLIGFLTKIVKDALFTGWIKIHFNRGAIAKIDKHETLKI